MAHRVAWITGAGRGIGRACALALAGAEIDTALVARSADELGAVADEVKKLGRRAVPFPSDLLDSQSLPTLCKRIDSELGPPDILVNNAGLAFSKKIGDTTREEWDRAIGLNMTAPFILSREVLPGMLERGWGRIINIASTAGLHGYAFTSAYTASKHGLIGLTRALALEVRDRGVTVHAVCPGCVNSRMTDESVANIVEKTGRTEEEARGVLARMNPHGRLVEPEEVAAVVARLAADDEYGAACKGEAIVVDGSEEAD